MHDNDKSAASRPNEIVISATDIARLEALATASLERFPLAAELLLQEIERATVRPPAEMPDNVVAMNSRVRFRDEGTGAERQVELVYPQEANIEAGRISVLTPIGAALIGVGVGQSISCPTQNGRSRALTVLAIS